MHIALLTGWISAERPISLRSSEGLQTFISETSHTYDVYDIPREIDAFLSKYQSYDIVFPYIHGRYGEDGSVTGLCETLGLRYIGSPSTTHALCIDKYYTNCAVEKLWVVQVPKSWIPGIQVPKMLGFEENTLTQKTNEELPAPVIVKPNCGGSTVATNKAKTIESLVLGIEEVYQNTASLAEQNIALIGSGETSFVRKFPDYTDRPIVQEYIEGEEYTVGVYGSTHQPQILPIMQIVNIKAELFDWQEKYESDGTNEIFAEHISSDLRENLEAASRRIYTSLGCSGVVRIDYRVRGNEIFFLEVNTFPGATTASFIPKMWRKSGKNMGEFIEMLINTAR
jgi:D-alanine-D-alanine ligase